MREDYRRREAAADPAHRDHRYWRRDDEQLVELAWLACCRHVGAPSPLSDARTERLLAEEDSKRRLDSLREVKNHVLVPTLVDPLRAYTLHRIGGLDADLRARLDEVIDGNGNTAIQALMMAYDLADEATRLVQLANARIDTVAAELEAVAS